MKKTVAFVSGLVAITGAAAASVSYTGTPYFENFNSLGPAQSGAFSSTIGVQASIPGLPSWQGAKIAGTGSTNMNWNLSDGGANAGALYNYGVAGDTDRALGSLASGANTPAFGVEIVNNSGSTLTEFTISFEGKQFRSSTTTQNVLAFAWGLSTQGILSSNFLSSALMTADTSGDIVGQAPVATNGIISPPASLGIVTVTITGISVAVGESIFLRWQDRDDPGNDAGLAIDNFTFVPTPGAMAMLGLGGLLAARRRR
jgi:hypothetical protein